MVYWLIGMSGAGKTTVGRELYKQLKTDQPDTVLIDGDEVREIFKHENHGDYSIAERKKNAERICEMCKWLDRQNINVVCCILSIFEESRDWNRETYSQYFEVYIKSTYKFLKANRDYKGIYTAAEAGDIPDVVGVDIQFLEPLSPNLIIDNYGDIADIPEIAAKIINESRLSLSTLKSC